MSLLAPLAWAGLSPPGANDLVGGDEGYYAVMARNILADRVQVLTVSRTPRGEPGDKPPLYPALLAASLRVFGMSESALRWPSFLCAALALLGTGLVTARLGGDPAGFVATLVLATLPWFADASRVVAAELPLTVFGIAALLAIEPAPSARRALGAGLLLGLGFASKLWLVAPFALAVLLRLWPFRSSRPLFALAGGFALTGGAHLAAVAWLAPQQFAHWREVYWLFSFRDRVAGAGYADYWRQPSGYYAGMVLRAFALGLPLLALGFADRLRRLREPGTRLLLGWLAGIALLSAFRVKSGGYVYPIVPAFAVLAGLGAASAGARWPRVAALLVAIAVAGGAWRVVQRLPLRYHAPGYADVARALEPWLAGVPADSVSVLTPEAPAFEAYLFRRARYWDSAYDPWTAGRFARLRTGTVPAAFVTDEARRFYGGGPDPKVMGWLTAHTRELTGDIERQRGRPLGVRVFVRGGAEGHTGLEPSGTLR